MKRFWMIPAALAVAALAACDEPTKQPEPSSTAAAAVAPAKIDDADLAVKADFEAEAEEAVTAASYKQELDTAERELGGK